jgi:NAD dependent epimerase/dehydratase family enzyme
VVLGEGGGAIEKMIIPLLSRRPIGDGQAGHLPIHRDDVVGMILADDDRVKA